jgi:LacI family transcriptional regulator
MNKVTIEDISRQTGLSRGTVSRALNDRPDISQQTKQKVLEACRRLRYVPSHAARALATGRRCAVAVLVDDLRSTFAAGFLRGVLARARAQRYAVILCELGADTPGALEQLRALAAERVDGVLLAAPLPPDAAQAVVEALDERPIVAVSALEGIACDVLTPDAAEAGRLAANHIVRPGAADVLYVHEDGAGSPQTLAGFQEVCRRQRLDPRAVTVVVSRSGGAGAQWLDPLRGRLAGVRAIAASSDFLAVEIAFLCAQAGRAVGRDVGLIGQGNEAVGAVLTPTLTTIDYCGEEIGRRALDIALQRVSGVRQDAPQRTLVPPVLVARDSTRLPG